MYRQDGFMMLEQRGVRLAARRRRRLPQRMAPRSVSKTGQHSTEFAILIGLVTLAAVTMQFVARRGLQAGVRMVSDVVLGEPPAPKPPDPTDPVSTLSVRRCDDPVHPDAVVTATGSDLVLLQVACSNVTEQGDSAFRRVTTTSETNRGVSINEDARLQVFEE